MTESVLYKCILFQKRQILCKSCVFIIISAHLSTFNLTDFLLPCIIIYSSAHPFCLKFSKRFSIVLRTYNTLMVIRQQSCVSNNNSDAFKMISAHLFTFNFYRTTLQCGPAFQNTCNYGYDLLDV